MLVDNTSAIKIVVSVSVAGCLGYDVLVKRRKQSVLESKFQLLVV